MPKKLLLSSIMAFLFSGCVSIDKRGDEETIDRAATANFSATFANQANYKSNADGPVIDNLANLLFIPASQSASAQVSFNSSTGLNVKYADAKQSRHIPMGDKLKLNKDGVIELSAESHCTAEKGVLGCDRKQIAMFINTKGELVTIHTDTVGGMFLIMPYAHYKKNVAIFPRVK